MNSKHIGADLNFAWPSAEIAVMGCEGAAEIISKGNLGGIRSGGKARRESRGIHEEICQSLRAAHRGYVDEVIYPDQTREKLISAFKMLENKVAVLPKKKHGNIPL